MKKILFTIFFLYLLFVGCEQKKEMQKTIELSQYVFVDKSKCLHVDKRCMNLRIHHDENGNRDNYQVQFKDTAVLNETDFSSFCSRCVENRQYEKLQRIVKCHDSNYDEDYFEQYRVE